MPRSEHKRKGKPIVEPHYSDFKLGVISHLSGDLMMALTRNGADADYARLLLEKSLRYGKNIIAHETRPGDLVLLESPHRFTKEHYERCYAGTGFEGLWNRDLGRAFNFYHELAEHARKTGRRVGSLEPSWMHPDSRLFPLATSFDLRKIPDSLRSRLQYLTTYRRNHSMRKRIQAKKPQLVITAPSHGLYLMDAMKPKVVINPYVRAPQMPWRLDVLSVQESEDNAYRNLKRERLRKKRGKK